MIKSRLFYNLLPVLAFVSAVPLQLSAQEVQLTPQTAVDTATRSERLDEQATDAATQAAIAASTARPVAPSASRTVQTPLRRRIVPATFVLRDIRFTPSKYLSQEQLSQVEESLVGTRYHRGALNAIAASISQLYLNQGIYTAQALVRNVNFANGVLDVELLEARIGQVNYRSNALSQKYLAFRLKLSPSDLADNRVLERQLSAFQRSDGIELQAGYAPGAAHGLTDITIASPDILKHSTTVTVDNYGTPSTGKAQLTVAHVVNNLTGWNDPLRFSYTHREGSAAVSLGYRRVVFANGAAVYVSISGSTTDTLSTPSAAGENRSATIGLHYPVISEPRRQLSFSGAISFYDETSDILGVRTLDQRGREISLNMSTVNRGENWSLTGSFGLMAGQYDNAIIAQNDIHYTAATIQASYARALGPDMFATLTFAAQKTLSGLMPSTRQFSVTAPNAVRGYPAGLSAGSSGYFMRMQLEKSTAFDIGNGKLGVRPFAFADVGEAFDSTNVGLGLASSVGVGMSFTKGNSVFGDIFIAKPLSTAITGWVAPSDKITIGGSISIRF